MSAALQLEHLMAKWAARHGELAYRGRSTKLIEFLDLHYSDGSCARLRRDQGKELWDVIDDPDDRSNTPQQDITPQDITPGADPAWRRPYQARR